jgi:hypothetical protein
MWLAIIAGCLFLAGAVSNLVGETRDIPNAIVGSIIGVVLLGVPLLYRWQRRYDEHFLDWLSKNAERVLHKGAEYRGAIITGESVLTKYETALSFLVVSLRVPSRYYIVNAETGRGVAAFYTTLSLLFGWWGIPWGPIYTVRSIVSNGDGGKKISVAELLASRATPAPLTPIYKPPAVGTPVK